MLYKYIIAVGMLFTEICQAAPHPIPAQFCLKPLNELIQTLQDKHNRLILEISAAYDMHYTYHADKTRAIWPETQNPSLCTDLQTKYHNKPSEFLKTKIQDAIAAWSTRLSELQTSPAFKDAAENYSTLQAGHAIKAHPLYHIQEAFYNGQQFLQKSIEPFILVQLKSNKDWLKTLHVSLRVFFNKI